MIYLLIIAFGLGMFLCGFGAGGMVATYSLKKKIDVLLLPLKKMLQDELS